MRVHEVRDFSKRGDALPIPNLIDIQIESYQRFLQKEVEVNKRMSNPPSERTRALKPFCAKCFRSKVTTETCGWST